MAESVKIYFVTWPDGRIFEGTQTSVAERQAVAAALANILPKAWFPDLDLFQGYYGSLGCLWESMAKAGFRVQHVEVDATGFAS